MPATDGCITQVTENVELGDHSLKVFIFVDIHFKLPIACKEWSIQLTVVGLVVSWITCSLVCMS